MTEHQEFSHTPGDVWAALFTPQGRPRDRWLNIIRKRVYASARRRVPDIVQMVFDDLSERFIARAAAGSLRTVVPLETYLTTRFARDTGRVAQRIVGVYGGLSLYHEDGEPIAALSDPDNELLDPDRILQDGRIGARVAELLDDGTLGPREREAFLRRASCGFEPEQVYARYGLDERRARNAHNNAFREACRKLRRKLDDERYVP